MTLSLGGWLLLGAANLSILVGLATERRIPRWLPNALLLASVALFVAHEVTR